MLLLKHTILGILLATLVYHSDAEICSWEINATEAVQNLTMPSFEQSNESCWWRLQAVEDGHNVVMEVMNPYNVTGCPTTTLEIYDGQNSSDPLLGEICANEKMSIVSSGRTLYIYMEQGYSFTVTRILIQVFSVTQCGGQLTSLGIVSNLTSPGYPQHYFRNLNCSWIISTESETETVKLKLTDIDMDQSDMCENGSIAIYNSNSSEESLLLGRFCGKSGKGYIVQSSRNTLKIEFNTRVSSPGMYKGFRLMFYSVPGKHCNFTNVVQDDMPMFIYSPGYPNQYYNNLACVWIITAPSSDIVLEVVNSNLEGSPPACSKDSVTVWDFGGIKDLHGTFCGNSTPNFTTPGGVMAVRFTTNNVVAKTGFRLKYYAVKQIITTTPAPSCGPQNLTAIQSDQYLVSPGYPMTYAKYLHVDCQWTVTSSDPDMMVRVEVLDSQMQGGLGCTYGDKVYVYDGPDKTAAIIQIWCGHMEPVVQSSGSTLTLRFVTTDYPFRRGFKLKYTDTREPLKCGGEVSVTNSTGQYLFSPGYPVSYRRNMICLWILRSPQNTSIHIRIWESSVGDGNTCTDSSVSVSDDALGASKKIGVFCGDKRPAYTSSGNVMSIILHTGPGSVKKGFAIKYTSGSFQDPYDCGGHIQLNATVNFYRLRPPGYYSNYYFDMKCVWVIETNSQNMKVSIEKVDLTVSPSCKEEYVAINDGALSQPSVMGRYCTLQYSEDHVTSGRTMAVTFQSRQPNNVKGGFSIFIHSGGFDICSLQEQMAWDTITHITSPNYPFNYPRNAHCSWRLDTNGDADIAIQLRVISFNTTKTSTSCDSNYLEAFDGYDPSSPSLARWCGADHADNVISSTGRYLFLKFDTSYDTPNTGFNVSIKRTFRREESSHKGLIIGVAVGVTAGVFVIVAIGYQFVRRGSCFQSDTIAHRTNLRRFFYKNTHQ